MFKHILLAYDFGNSFSHVPAVLEKVVGDDTHITVLNVVLESELANYVRYENIHLDDLAKLKEDELRPFLNHLDAMNVHYDTKFLSGLTIPSTILEELETGDYDLVVMSNKRSKPDIKHVLGHVTHKVAKRTNVPVLIVK